MIIEPFKMKVNPEQSEKVQKILFANGYKWKNGVPSILHTNYSFLYFNDDRTLAHRMNDAAYFVHSHLKEISFDEFMLKYTGVIDVCISGSDLHETFSRKNIPEKWFVKVTPKNYSTLNCWLLMQKNFNTNFLLEEYSGGNVGNVNRDGSYQDWDLYGENFKKLGHKEITLEQFEKYVLYNLKNETMKKEIIGYRIKEQFRNNRAVGEAAAKIEGHRCFGDGVTELPFSKLAISCLQNANKESIEKLTKAGILDLWFEPVYKEVEPEIVISGHKAQFDLQNKTVKFGCKTISLEQLKAVLTVMDLNWKFDYGFCIASDFIESYHLHDFEPVKKQTIGQLIQILEK
jgi:hypothetical protein